MKRVFSAFLCAVLIFLLSVSAFAASEEKYFTYGDYNLHYVTIGHSGEFKGRIAMLHGFLCSTYAWRNMAEGLSREGYDCVLIDLPNFGKSTRENDSVQHVDREILVTELLKTIAPMDEWILAGHSMGGGVAINIAEAEPVKALLLYCPAPQGTVPSAFKPLLTSKPMCFLMNTFFDVGLKITPLVRLIIYAATLDCEFAKGYDISGVTAPLSGSSSGEGMCHMVFRVRETDLESTDKIAAPVLIVQAEKDLILSASMKDQINTAFPDAEKYEVAGGGHQCIENRADELVKLTIDFLK